MSKRSSSGAAAPKLQPAKDKPMYSLESHLQHLPVPALDSTLEKYFASLLPHVSDQSVTAPTASDSNPTEAYKKSKAAVEEFGKSELVKTLQGRLEQRAKEKESWLSEWWNETAYFGYRDPVVPYVNYFYIHRDDKRRKEGPKRAAGLVKATLTFRRLAESEALLPEMVRDTPLCMSTYKYLFNSVRYPVKDVDTAKRFDTSSGKYEHIVAIRKGKFYEIPIKHENGQELSQDELEGQFRKVVEAAGSEADANPVGALTSDNRDNWTKAREELVKDSKNAAAIERIESAIILVALDDTKPVTREDVSWTMWVGDGKNRFFDKHQIIVTENGKSGFNGEHSCMDGTPTSRLNDWLLRSLSDNKIDLGTSSSSSLPAPTPLTFNITSSTSSAIKSAISSHQELMGRHELSVLQYDGYGKNVIKSLKTSPDSWAQLVMQLAYFKMTGKTPATYESAQTRKFKFGRTEVIRTASKESLEWCKSMENEDVSDEERLKLFREAVKRHGQWAKWAADGQGVDRHLFGLKKLLKEGEELPALYKDPLFSQSSSWVLSTSQLASEFFEGWGYGEVVPDGYGLAYAVNNDSLRFTITTLNGDAKNFRHYLSEAATEVRKVMESGQKKVEGEKAKL